MAISESTLRLLEQDREKARQYDRANSAPVASSGGVSQGVQQLMAQDLVSARLSDKTKPNTSKIGSIGSGVGGGGQAGGGGGRKETPAPETLGERISNLGTALGGAVLSGADAAATGITSTADFLLGRPLQALGWEDNPITALNEKLQTEREQHTEYFTDQLRGDKLSSGVYNLGTAVSRAAWELPLIIMTGGMSKAAQGTTKGLEAAAALETTLKGSGIGQTVANTVNTLQRQLRNPQVWQSFTSATGQDYEEQKANGASEIQAVAHATITGLLNAAVEVGGGGLQELPDVLRQPSRLRNWINTMLDEGKEEVVQGVIDRLAENALGISDRPIFSTTDEDAVFNPSTALEEFGMGALVGGILGGGQIAVDSALNRIGRVNNETPSPMDESVEQFARDVAEMNSAFPYTEAEAAKIRREGKTFRNIIAGIDTTVSNFFKKWSGGRKSHQGEKLEKLYLGKLSEDSLRQVSDILGYDVTGRDVIVTNDDVKHIMDNHPDLPSWAVEALTEVVQSPSNIREGHEGSGRNAGKTGVIFEREYPDGTVVSVQFDNPGRGTLQVTTLYVNTKKRTTSEATADNSTAARTPIASEPVRSNNIIPNSEQSVNASEIPNSSAVQDVNSPVTPDSSAVNPESSVGAMAHGVPEAAAYAAELRDAAASLSSTGDLDAFLAESARIAEDILSAETEYSRQHWQRGEASPIDANQRRGALNEITAAAFRFANDGDADAFNAEVENVLNQLGYGRDAWTPTAAIPAQPGPETESSRPQSALANSMTDEELAQEQARIEEDLDSVNAVLEEALNDGVTPQSQIDALEQMLNELTEQGRRLANVEQAKRIDRGEVSRNFGQPENHIDNRDAQSVKGTRVSAFTFDHPQLHGYFTSAARDLQAMADYAQAADRQRNNRGPATARARNAAAASHAYTGELNSAIAAGNLTKPQILDACQRIIDNHGQENVLAAKRVELVLDDMLTNGYTRVDGIYI